MIVQIQSVPVRLSKGDRTKNVILDAAEREFATFGFDAVSVRQVAEAAGQGVGVLTYHFPAKEALFGAVVARRADELTTLRRVAVEDLRGAKLEDLLHAFLKPFLERIENGGEGWRFYARILAHLGHEARWAPLADQLFGDSSRDFIRRMRDAEPGLTWEAAMHCYAHLIANMVGLFASTGLLDRLSNGRLRSEDISANYEPAVRFLAGGIRALAQAPGPGRSAS